MKMGSPAKYVFKANIKGQQIFFSLKSFACNSFNCRATAQSRLSWSLGNYQRMWPKCQACVTYDMFFWLKYKSIHNWIAKSKWLCPVSLLYFCVIIKNFQKLPSAHLKFISVLEWSPRETLRHWGRGLELECARIIFSETPIWQVKKGDGIVSTISAGFWPQHWANICWKIALASFWALALMGLPVTNVPTNVLTKQTWLHLTRCFTCYTFLITQILRADDWAPPSQDRVCWSKECVNIQSRGCFIFYPSTFQRIYIFKKSLLIQWKQLLLFTANPLKSFHQW